jgi:hypothetical protein
MKTETPVFPKRVVLAEGYPWANGIKPDEYFEITMRNQPVGGPNLVLNWPPILWRRDVPKYRLVLEVIE